MLYKKSYFILLGWEHCLDGYFRYKIEINLKKKEKKKFLNYTLLLLLYNTALPNKI